jgi:hypothetical protein
MTETKKKRWREGEMGKGRGEKNSVEIISALHVPFWRVSVAALSWREPGEPGVGRCGPKVDFVTLILMMCK